MASSTITTLSKFQSDVMQAIVPKNRFEVVFAKFPESLVGFQQEIHDLPLYCDSLDIPGITVQTKEARTYGPLYQVPFQRRFDQIAINFILTKEYNQKRIFDAWFETIMGFDESSSGSNNVAYFNDITANIQIKNYGFDLSNLYNVTIVDAYPVVLKSDFASWDSVEIQKLNIEFNYRDILFNSD